MSFSPFEFALVDLSCTVQLSTKGLIPDGVSVPDMSYNSIAFLNVSLSDMRKTFQVATTDISMNDMSGCLYYVFDTSFTPVEQCNISTATVISEGAYAPIALTDTHGATYNGAEQSLANDYIRYIALKLFGTHYGVALFANPADLEQDISNVCTSVSSATNVYPSLLTQLGNVSTSVMAAGPAAAAITDELGLLALPDTYTSADNLSRELIQQMFNLCPTRLQNDDNGLLLAQSSPQPVPFIANDVISFPVTFNVADGQEAEVAPECAPIPSWTYLIRLTLVE